MMCDFIIAAADNARFGQPEIKLHHPRGRQQRLPCAVGKAKGLWTWR